MLHHFFICIRIYIICCFSHTLSVDLSLFPPSSHSVFRLPLSHCHSHCAQTHSCGTSHLQRVPHSHHPTYQINVPSFSSPITGPQRRDLSSVITPLRQGPEAWACLRLMDPRSDRPSVAPHLRQRGTSRVQARVCKRSTQR